MGRQAGKGRGHQQQARRLGTATMPTPPDSRRRGAEVAQHDRQVVDVHRAAGIAVHTALRPNTPRLAELGEQDRQVVDVDLAVQVGVAGSGADTTA